ncbi:Sister chromatid cohesion protein 2 [Phytophthora pseudosyringae]|uniref:Sister chromatid cohesion protein n=1 Tax=Phytophthora pseudosyringae TaxID=221518 RepID=A0A8T1WMT9_9STRA|nr:Sister chromatid cohesion protein 2 [Phytophthora pseudosyringae]
MRGGMFLFPLYVDPADAAAADARETIHPVASEPAAGAESFNPQRLATVIHSSTSGRLSSQGETTEIDADVLNSLPKWAQAVVQTGCFNAGGIEPSRRNKVKRGSELQDESNHKRRRKRRSLGKDVDQQSLTEDEVGELQDGLDELNTALGMDPDEEEEDEELPAFSTQAEITADNVEKYAELVKKLVDMVTDRQEQEFFERDDLDVFHPEEVKMLLQSLKAMEKNNWINKLEPELLISLMSAFDAQVQLGLAADVLGADLSNKERGKAQIDERLVSRLVASLDIAICELIVMTTSQIDRRVLSEETIDNCFQLLQHIIRHLLLPCIDTSYVTTATTSVTNENDRRQSTGRKTSGSSRVNLRTNKSARKAVERVSHVTCEFMDQLAALVLGVKLADRWILRLSSSMVELFALDPSSYATSLQQSALGILRGIFLKYKPHRESLLGDIVEIMVKLPTAKRTLRTVKLLNSSDMVQRISTLVVSVIQSSAAASKFGTLKADVGLLQDSIEPSSTPDTVIKEKAPQKNDVVATALEDTRNTARLFVRMLLKACWKRTEERDNRMVLDNFVEDLLMMFVRPEWVGAEFLLEVLSSSLASILHANISADVKNPDSHQSMAALNLVGKICASIKQYQKMVGQTALEGDSDSKAVIEEHTSCLREVLAGKNTRSTGAVSNASTDLFHQIALKHLIVMHLQRHNFDQGDSKKLLILKFILESEVHWHGSESVCVDRERELWESLWGVPMGGINSTFKVAAPTNELALKSSLNLAVKREFCGLFESLLAHIMALLSKGLPSLRARVMKCLRGIVDVDPMLMAENGVQLAVERCCSDEKPSVREAAVDLIGTYVLLQPRLFDKYFDVLAERVRDKGIKVRKSVCKIFKIALTSMQDQSCDTTSEQKLRRKSACMRCLVERIGHAAEDQGVKNFIIDTFQEVWFGAELSSSRLTNPLSDFGDGNTLPPGWTAIATMVDEKVDSTSRSKSSTTFVSEDGSVVTSVEEAWSSYRTPTVTPASVVKNNDAKLDNRCEVVATIVEVIHGVPHLGWFTELLKRLLAERNSNPKKVAAQPSKNRSAQVTIAEDRSGAIVDSLVDCLLGIKEGTLLKGVSIENPHAQFVACMTALSAFCEAKPQLLARHLETIRVHLTEDDPKVQSLSVSMINNILRIKRVPKSFAEKLEGDLKLLVQRSPPSVVGPSVECLATLSATRKKALVLLLNLLEQFFLSIRKYKQRASLADLTDRDNFVLQRALFVAGKIVGTTDIDNCPELASNATVLQIGTITESLYELYTQFVRMLGNDACAAKAVQGMGFLFPIRPRLFLHAQQDGLLSFLLKANTRKTKLQCLVSMKELLLFEEQRLENGLATRSMNQSKSKEQQVQGDQEADASLIGNVMQAELGNILVLLLQKVPQIRKEAIACIGVLLTQGLVNYLQCIPYLVALETDRVLDVRDAAFSQLLALYERFRGQFHTPLIQGIQDSHPFQLSVYGNATALGVDENKKDFCLFGRLYTNCVKSHGSRFLEALVNQFTDQGRVLKPLKSEPATAKMEGFTTRLKYLCYLAQIISTLPYEVEDEPLHIIYLINRYVSLRLGPVLDDFRKTFAKVGVAPKLLEEDDESDLSTLKIDDYKLRPLASSELTALQTYGGIAFAIAVLLRLKLVLKRNFQLDNEKCATYKPSATDAPVEAKERSPKKLLLPSVDDLCQADDPIEVNWNLFMVAWCAARKDQKQLDIDLEEVQKPKATPKRRRRSRKSVTAKKRKMSENDSDVDDGEDVEGFA